MEVVAGWVKLKEVRNGLGCWHSGKTGGIS